MGRLFDALFVDAMFQEHDGEMRFYPFGLLSRAYRLPPDREAGVRSATRRLTLFALAGAAAWLLVYFYAPDSPDAITRVDALLVALFVFLFAVINAFQARLARGLEAVDGPRPTLGAWFRAVRAKRPGWLNWMCLGIGALFLVSAAAAFLGGDVTEAPVAVLLAVMGALMTWDSVLGIKERSVARRAARAA